MLAGNRYISSSVLISFALWHLRHRYQYTSYFAEGIRKFPQKRQKHCHDIDGDGEYFEKRREKLILVNDWIVSEQE